ncbi:GntR family transcriptional regulator [Segetibacter aerophilus]|uniref:GntR family transcriptional regulator n=1 Tax=Segetibacter aerophilus TaxID=670293 RepID=A0A512BF37_9BACT|nr:GntR family transcriptional regulator [Segetibacter aerophilus]GEO10554.1 GntR family transcriptional regulator [Segetibacter aerophilus]
MEFRENQAIYIQIAEYVCEQILLKKWELGEKILSIRELAVLMQVTPNTVQRAYDFLQQKQIISNKRGIGYFTDADALERILAFRKEQFIANELPVFFRNMYLLDVDFKEVNSLYQQFINDNFKK